MAGVNAVGGATTTDQQAYDQAFDQVAQGVGGLFIAGSVGIMSKIVNDYQQHLEESKREG